MKCCISLTICRHGLGKTLELCDNHNETIRIIARPDLVVQACNSNYSEDKAKGLQVQDQPGELGKALSQSKSKKRSGAVILW